MYSLLCTLMLAATPGMAKYSVVDFDGTRNMLQRELPLNKDGMTYVQCPVCDMYKGWRYHEEECEYIDGQKVKKCKYGTYLNTACGGRFDCLRGPNDRCSQTDEAPNWQCTAGYVCSALNKCSGIGAEQDELSKLYALVSPSGRWAYRSME